MRGASGRWFGSAGRGLRTEPVSWKQHELLYINTIFCGKPYRKFLEIFCPQNAEARRRGRGSRNSPQGAQRREPRNTRNTRKGNIRPGGRFTANITRANCGARPPRPRPNGSWGRNCGLLPGSLRGIGFLVSFMHNTGWPGNFVARPPAFMPPIRSLTTATVPPNL